MAEWWWNGYRWHHLGKTNVSTATVAARQKMGKQRRQAVALAISRREDNARFHSDRGRSTCCWLRWHDRWTAAAAARWGRSESGSGAQARGRPSSGLYPVSVAAHNSGGMVRLLEQRRRQDGLWCSWLHGGCRIALGWHVDSQPSARRQDRVVPKKMGDDLAT